jgi:hypothetical protein
MDVKDIARHRDPGAGLEERLAHHRRHMLYMQDLRVGVQPVCGVCFTVAFSGLAIVAAWFVLILHLSCTPWSFHGPLLIATGGLLFILWASFVPLGVECQTRGILTYACERCGMASVQKGSVTHDVHPLTQIMMVMILSLLAVVIGFFISRDRLPDITLYKLEIQTNHTTNEWFVAGAFNIPWCENGQSIHISKTTPAESTFPFAVKEDDGSFIGFMMKPLASDGDARVTGLTATCGGCFATSQVSDFQWTVPGWRKTPDRIPFLDKESIGTYIFPPLSVTMLLGIMHAAYCMFFNFSIFQCPCPPRKY